MKPNFALSLSFEGIGLLHRAEAVWDRVGEVPLDVPDLPEALELLRKTAQDLTDDALTAKLLLPAEQIKYMRLADPGGSEDIRKAAVEAALDGATPYSLTELAIDWAEDDGELTVAAVAKETLLEAENFASDNGFEPLYFAAQPDIGLFKREPFFGETSYFATLSETLERDTDAIVIGGVASKRKSEAAPETNSPSEDGIASVNSAEKPSPELRTEKPTSSEGENEATVAPAFSTRRDAGVEGVAPSLAGVSRHEPKAVSPSIPIDVDAPPTEQTTTPKPEVLHATPAPAPLPKSSPAASKAAPDRGVMSFFSRRGTRTSGASLPKASAAESMRSAAPTMPPPNVVPRAASEKQRLTIFGARKPEPAQASAVNRPRFLGLILTAVLLIFLIGVGAWASIFVDDGLSGLFGRSETKIAELPADTVDELLVEGEEAMVLEPPVQTASLDTGIDEIATEDIRPAPSASGTMSLAEAQEKYAVTGIWALAPDAPPVPAAIREDDIYIPSIDSEIGAQDAIALPELALTTDDDSLREQSNPTTQGKTFKLDARGLVLATPEGALSPDGFMIYSGPPPLRPENLPDRSKTETEDAAQENRLAAFRPKARPEGLVEGNERALLGGLTRAELRAIRPKMRPASAQQLARIAPEETEPADNAVPTTPGAVAIKLPDPTDATPDLDPNATPQAVAQSVKPKTRPRNFSRIVERAKKNDERVTQVAAVAPRTVAPKIPSRASVAKQATVRNAINLRRVNLIGVYGKPSSRRALVRLANGRYKKVKVGDRIDGGRVSAIGDGELRYQKNGRNVTLKMPRG